MTAPVKPWEERRAEKEAEFAKDPGKRTLREYQKLKFAAIMEEIAEHRARAEASLQAVGAVPEAILERTEAIRQSFTRPGDADPKWLKWTIECLLAHIAFTNQAPQPAAAPSGDVPVSVRALADNLIIAVDNLGHAEGGLEGLDQLHAAARHLRRGLGEWPCQ